MVGLNLGLTVPYTSLKLKYLHASEFTIGLIASTPALGMVLIALFINPVTKLISIKSLFIWSILALTLSILPLAYIDNFFILFLLRFSVGVACSALVIMGESCINDLANNTNRGRLIGIYTTFFTACQILGPFLLSLFGTKTNTAIWLLLLIHILGFLITVRVPLNFSFHGKQKHNKSLFYFLKTMPVIILGTITFAFFDLSILSIMPLYSVEHGYSDQLAVLIVSMVFIGDACLQIPFCWLSDTYGRVKTHFICGLGLLILTILVPFVMSYQLALWPILFLWGGFAGSAYTIGLIRVGDHFIGSNLIAANACLGLVWGLGGLIAPIGSVSLMHYLGNDGLFIGIGLITIIFLLSFAKKVRVE